MKIRHHRPRSFEARIVERFVLYKTLPLAHRNNPNLETRILMWTQIKQEYHSIGGWWDICWAPEQ